MSQNNTVVIVALLILTLVTGVLIGRASVSSTVALDTSPSTVTRTSTESGTAQGDAATVDTANLTEGQRSMLGALGIDADTVTITPEMVACAEASLGTARIEEIKNGATPNVIEGGKLMACYK